MGTQVKPFFAFARDRVRCDEFCEILHVHTISHEIACESDCRVLGEKYLRFRVVSFVSLEVAKNR